MGIPYLSRVREAEAKVKVKVGNGYICGLTNRAIVPFIVGHKDEAHSSIHCWPAIKTRPVGYYFLYWTAVHR